MHMYVSLGHDLEGIHRGNHEASDHAAETLANLAMRYETSVTEFLETGISGTICYHRLI